MKVNVAIRALFIVFSGMLIGCNDIEDCAVDPNFGALKIQFFDRVGDVLKTENIDSVKAIGSDTLFFISEDLVSSLELDLDPFNNNVTYVFFDNLSTDSLVISYTRINELVSPECGPSIAFNDLQVVTHTFDSVAVSNTFFNSNLEDNLEVYR